MQAENFEAVKSNDISFNILLLAILSFSKGNIFEHLKAKQFNT